VYYLTTLSNTEIIWLL